MNRILAALAAAALGASCLARAAAESDMEPMAPELTHGLAWLNTDRPLTLKELRGQVVVLDFWTYG